MKTLVKYIAPETKSIVRCVGQPSRVLRIGQLIASGLGDNTAIDDKEVTVWVAKGQFHRLPAFN